MKKTYGTQCERIVKYMQDFGTITTAEAMLELGVYRLASRINDLKKARAQYRENDGRSKEPIRRNGAVCAVSVE